MSPRFFALAALMVLADACKPKEPKSAYESEYDRCRRYQGSHEICDHIAKAKAGPGPEISSDKWIALEATAKSFAKGGEDTKILRLSGVGMMVTAPIELLGEHCYRIGVGTPDQRKAHLAVAFVPTADGTYPHDHFRGKEAPIEAGGGVAEFCTDRAGSANVSVSALGDAGYIAVGTRLEYAVAIVAEPEPAEAREKRHVEDAQKAKDARATICANCTTAYKRCLGSGNRKCYEEVQSCMSGYDCMAD